MVRTDIVIVNYNTRRYLDECLSSIRKYSGPASLYQVLVVDNGSTDGSVQLLRQKTWVKTIFNTKNSGYATACNQGITAGNGRFIILLNSDTIMTENWLQPMLTVLGRTDTAVVGPRMINLEGCLVGVGVIGTNKEPFMRGIGEPDEPARYNRETECLSVSGACMGIRRDLIPKLGVFDEHYFHYFEETDYCYNARLHGYKVIYCPESKVIHRVYGSCRDYGRLNRYYAESKAYFDRKWRHFLNDPQTCGEKTI